MSLKKDPSTLSAEELREYIAELEADLEEVKDEKAFLQRLAKVQVPGHQIERYEHEIESLEGAIREARGFLPES